MFFIERLFFMDKFIVCLSFIFLALIVQPSFASCCDDYHGDIAYCDLLSGYYICKDTTKSQCQCNALQTTFQNDQQDLN